MRLLVLCVGKLRDRPVREAVGEYLARLVLGEFRFDPPPDLVVGLRLDHRLGAPGDGADAQDGQVQSGTDARCDSRRFFDSH